LGIIEIAIGIGIGIVFNRFDIDTDPDFDFDKGYVSYETAVERSARPISGCRPLQIRLYYVVDIADQLK
jgi:hypothetical protein